MFGTVEDGTVAVILVEVDVVEAAVVGAEKGLVSGVPDEQEEVFLETGAALGMEGAQFDKAIGLGVGKVRVDADVEAAGAVGAAVAVLDVGACELVVVEGDNEMDVGPKDAWAVAMPGSK